MRLQHGPHSGKYLAECPLAYIKGMRTRNDRLGKHANWILSVWDEFGLLNDDYNDIDPPF